MTQAGQMRVELHPHASRATVRDCRRIQEWYGPENGVVPSARERVWVWRSDRWIAGFALAELDGDVMRTTNCVVAGPYRGLGGQRALLDARVRWAGAAGAARVETYIDARNWHSARNILAAGFEITEIDPAWVRFALAL